MKRKFQIRKTGGELNLGLPSLVQSKPNVPVTERQMVVLITTLMNLYSEKNLRRIESPEATKVVMKDVSGWAV